MSKFMFMQICQQAEMSIHLSQYKDNERAKSPINSARSKGAGVTSNRYGLKNAAGGAPSDIGNPLFETGGGRRGTVARGAMVSPGRSRNNVLTLDKDVNEMQLNFDMFKDCLN
mmetsp:Transcript_22466/g.27693  ORF Transcript_22466/g.27693 Transcript_22466/m.27693 type:complete len:113 (+) Transcript_22466:340-678(+)|eukprot:CAMPEP_0170459844 /NCGR_PEP_ID=MMETSP0123-20130129/6397_1 /TAXON_ID=182087 /ORGANISM="Favella ehrenbergii, Strain Fehren 1" /LENGTH=112 /DNA_ID=CAMNT_0010724565 /DNA_START=253 /DNA_END=591 /DNA_ORIENTATION=+